ncbi:MAG: hypothetical protein H7Y43_07630, partial [Akkermansiaceae bacterium]|nr:hypothetical protein [Verrucomicrobiales bacterium]
MSKPCIPDTRRQALFPPPAAARSLDRCPFPTQTRAVRPTCEMENFTWPARPPGLVCFTLAIARQMGERIRIAVPVRNAITMLLLVVAILFGAASGSAAPVPFVSFDKVPSEVMIGSEFTFTIMFKNTGTTPGYGPFIDLHVDSGGADVGQPADLCHPGQICDGLTVTSITGFGDMFFNSGATAPCSTAPVSFLHPFDSVNFLPSPFVTCPGGQLSVIKLKTGVVYPTEPEFPVYVTVKVSELADPNVPLTIMARAGFQFGGNPLNDPVTDPPVVS